MPLMLPCHAIAAYMMHAERQRDFHAAFYDAIDDMRC